MLTDEALAKLRAQHGDLVEVVAEGTAYYFRTPTDVEFEEYQGKMFQVARGTGIPGPHNRELCLRCLVAPDKDALRSLFERKARTATIIADKLSDLAGDGVELTVKKG